MIQVPDWRTWECAWHGECRYTVLPHGARLVRWVAHSGTRFRNAGVCLGLIGLDAGIPKVRQRQCAAHGAPKLHHNRLYRLATLILANTGNCVSECYNAPLCLSLALTPAGRAEGRERNQRHRARHLPCAVPAARLLQGHVSAAPASAASLQLLNVVMGHTVMHRCESRGCT